ncbi:MAG: response regulator [Desulfobacteraceae bacterium]|nr:response regulator [Desulfobacteraceae bacterium]
MAYNVLIVDDSSPMRAVIKKTIKASGFNVGRFHEASNGKQALDILKDRWLDIVLTDYNMPEMNGLDLLIRIKSDDNIKDIPIVIITTEGSRQRIDAFLEQGACAYIKKPFSPEQIKTKLNRILGEPDVKSSNDEQCDEGLDF